MRRILITLLAATPLTLAGCEVQDAGETEMAVDTAAPEAGADTAATRAEADRIRSEWARLAEAGDVAGVADLYATDAVMVGAGGSVLEGRRGIREGLVLDGVTGMELTSERTEIGADLVSDWGTFRQTVRGPGDEEQTVNGRYLAVVRRQPDGSWRIVQHLATTAPEAGATEADTSGMEPDTTP